MNKHSLKYLLIFVSCLFLAYSCVSEEDMIQTEKIEQEKKTFAIFSQSSNIQGKSSRTTIDYPSGFSFLMQRYDSLHKTNISGLINSTNKTVWNKKTKQHIFVEGSEFYVETRLHSQLIEEENGDKWVVFPKLNQRTVVGLTIALLKTKETEVYFYRLKEEGKFYFETVKLFQDRVKVNVANKTSGGDFLCGLYDTCNLDEVIITPNPPKSGPTLLTYYYEDENGGGCGDFINCPTPEGGGGGGYNPTNENPCEEIKKENEKSKNILNQSQIKDKINEMTKSIASDKVEKGFSFGVKTNGSYIASSVQVGNSSNINLPSNSPAGADYTITGSVHTHPSDGFDSFSPADFYEFANSYSANNSFRTIFVYASNSTVYSLTITNPDQLKNFMNNYPKSEYFDSNTNFWIKSSSIGIDFRKAYDDFYGVQNLTSDLAFALANSYVLAKHNVGIAISKQDTNGNFNTLFVNEKDSNYNQTTNCNL